MFFRELQTSQLRGCLLTECDLILCPCKIHLDDGIFTGAHLSFEATLALPKWRPSVHTLAVPGEMWDCSEARQNYIMQTAAQCSGSCWETWRGIVRYLLFSRLSLSPKHIRLLKAERTAFHNPVSVPLKWCARGREFC